MKILVAEDDAVSRELLKTTLNKFGHEVFTAKDGFSALQIFKKEDIQIAITDWSMPEMDGITLCNEIRSLSEKDYVYIIMMTARNRKNDLIEAFEKGADDYIIKPFEVDELKARINSALRIINLTKKLNHEIELHKYTEQRFNAIIKYSTDIIYTLDLKGNFTSISKIAKELTGYTEEELLKINFRDFIPEDEQTEIFNVFNTILKTGKPLKRYPFKVIIKNGYEKYFETSVGLLEKDTQILGFQGSSRDITERVKAQNALKESEKHNRMLVETMREGLWVIDINGILTFVNNSLCKMLGYSKQELIGQHVSMLHEEESKEENEEKIRRRKQGMSESYEKNYISREGAIIPVLVSSQPVFDANGRFEGSIAVITDISAMKKADQERKIIESQLLQHEKMASIGQLAAGVAHEINNPTGFVSSNLNTLSDYISDYNKLINEYKNLLNQFMEDTRLADYKCRMQNIKELEESIDIDFLISDALSLIKESCEGTNRIKRIVQDLKDFAHPGEDKPKYTDINKCIDSTLNVVWNELKYKAKVSKEFGSLPEILCYQQQLNQVFANLFINAAQAIEKEGLIKIKTNACNGNIEIIVSDTGVGISKKDISKVFDPFFTTKEVGKGTGLGLNVVYNIMKKHNGVINVESEVGKGTTFILQLPLSGIKEESAS